MSDTFRADLIEGLRALRGFARTFHRDQARAEDLVQDEKNRAFEQRAFAFCQERIQARQLPIHLVQASCLFDGSKIIFYF